MPLHYLFYIHYPCFRPFRLEKASAHTIFTFENDKIVKFQSRFGNAVQKQTKLFSLIRCVGFVVTLPLLGSVSECVLNE